MLVTFELHGLPWSVLHPTEWSPWRCKELQCNVVRIAERQARAVWRIDDAAVLDAENIQPRLPLFQFGSAGAGEGEVIEPGPSLVKGFTSMEIRKLMDANQGLAPEKPNDVMEGARVLVDHRLGPEQPLVPRSAAFEIGDSERHMSDAWEIAMTLPPCRRIPR